MHGTRISSLRWPFQIQESMRTGARIGWVWLGQDMLGFNGFQWIGGRENSWDFNGFERGF